MFKTDSPLRIFAFSLVASLIILLGVLLGLGGQALFITAVLAVIEITFSFDNAIINAKVLARLPRLWQTIFLTVGIIIAIFGMRVLFPIIIVVLTAHLGWHDVVNLALHHPQVYATHLEAAHPKIAAFGGAFLLYLSLAFFFDGAKDVDWLPGERWARRAAHWLVPPMLTIVSVLGVAYLAADLVRGSVLTAGLFGAATFAGLQALNWGLEQFQGNRGGSARQMTVGAALVSILYLEVLDASFSFDGVIGAFAITSNVILIAAGLGIGALWVRSLTVFMVRHEVLGRYRYIEHGAHYTVLVLAGLLLISIKWQISDFIPGLTGVVIIVSSIASSMAAERRSTLRPQKSPKN